MDICRYTLLIGFVKSRRSGKQSIIMGNTSKLWHYMEIGEKIQTIYPHELEHYIYLYMSMYYRTYNKKYIITLDFNRILHFMYIFYIF